MCYCTREKWLDLLRNLLSPYRDIKATSTNEEVLLYGIDTAVFQYAISSVFLVDLCGSFALSAFMIH